MNPLIGQVQYAYFSSVIVGFVWWIVDLFHIGRMVEERNKEVIEECMREAVRIYPDPVSMSPENVVTIDNEV